jgi:hypothetical protein
MRMLLWYVGLASLLFSGTAVSGDEKADFLIVPNPAKLVLYDMFQHRMTVREKNALPPGVAMRVTEANTTLGDGITACARVDIEGKAVFIEKDRTESLEDLAHHVGALLIEGARLRNDTLLVRQALDARDPDNRGWRLEPGMRSLVTFEEKSRTYIRTLSTSPRCGWVVLAPEERGTTWTLLGGGESTRTVADRDIRSRLESLVRHTNRIFVLLAREFGKATGRNLSPANLELSSSPRAFTCKIARPGHGNDFHGTIRALKARIQAEFPGVVVEESGDQTSLTVSGW